MVPNVYQIVYKLELFTLMYCLQKVVAKPSLVFTALVGMGTFDVFSMWVARF